jgi:nicotinamide riboside kinase
MTLLINLYGSSSAGKSSLMADLFNSLKGAGETVEMCPEIIKQWAWDGIRPNRYDQYYLMGQEIKQQSRLLGKVDYVISDSPVLQNSFYNYYINGEDNLYVPSMDYLRMVNEDGHGVLDCMLYRNKPYETKGRYQTVEESDRIATALTKYLKEREIQYYLIDGKDHERAEIIMNMLMVIKEAET